MNPETRPSAKPDTRTAIRQIIKQARDTLPFTMPAAELCAGPCKGCAKKLLELLDGEIVDWEQKLDRGEIPTLGDVNKFGRLCQKIYRAIAANGLIKTA
ncbi:hypothetical protein GNX18_13070 [Microbulbifer sp. SH-1]|uniref:hypothetical protein n=1 Tax=Microbulbifer sp. SH-1 TaxID=2681547 RepID=UPI00140DF23C|nr:hypothetical protein [Microbulbifer sp. SH-1]QIL90591.1 hypothetical protein GNX18_13070 [Microbulbifer sp. SH-1]